MLYQPKQRVSADKTPSTELPLKNRSNSNDQHLQASSVTTQELCISDTGINALDSLRTSQQATGSSKLQQCVESELGRYFSMLDGEPPKELHRLVMSQVEKTLLEYVLKECGNNQSRAAEYLGISRGTLRSRISEHNI